jgi:hypothetical protein
MPGAEGKVPVANKGTNNQRNERTKQEREGGEYAFNNNVLEIKH